MLNVPVLIDFSNSVIPQLETQFSMTSELSIMELTRIKMSSPQYYITVTFPHNFGHPDNMRMKGLTLNYGLFPGLSNNVRLNLPPSLGYGDDCCYKVEYFSWQRPYQPGRLLSQSKIQKTKIHEEYWRIPSVDRNYFLSYRDYALFTPQYQYTSTATLTRGSTTMDSLINNLDIINIVSITDANGILYPANNYVIYDDSSYWQPPITYIVNSDTPIPAPTVAIQWLNGNGPAAGLEYTVEYITPLGIDDVFFSNLEGQAVLDVPWYLNYPYPFGLFYY